jgi:hypothetical protein
MQLFGHEAKMTKVSFCITCKGRLHHLKETLTQNLRDNPSGGTDGKGPDVEFVVLNYNSPDGLDEWIKTDPEMAEAMRDGRLKYARYDDAETFRHSHAKNMAHRLATGDIVCNLDADNFTGPQFASYLNEKMKADPDHTFVHAHFGYLESLPVEQRGSFGRIALSRRNFMELGGYEESARHWGGEDGNLLIRSLALGLKPAVIDDPQYLQVIAHDNAERFKFTAQADQDAAKKRIKNAGLNFSLSSLTSRFQQVAGWAQANHGHFGEGVVYKGLDAVPETLAEMPESKKSIRPAFLGAVPYFKIRAMPTPMSQDAQEQPSRQTFNHS